MSEVSSIVVCFLFDGSEKYNRMTLNAVNSFLSTTPLIKVGLLFPNGYDESQVVSQLTDPTRAAVRRYQHHFQNWNPTQHKLDIIKFSDQFSTIFWLDSDAIVYHDLTELLLKFHVSPCKVAFMKDHVCYNPQFLNVWLDWRKISDPFIPQASFMGFKKEIMPSFFAAWKDTWRQWIEPVPFANFPNPVPSFPGSAFCTEQYALGMILESEIVTRADVYELRRITFPLKGLSGPSSPNSAGSSANLDYNFNSQPGAEKALSEQELILLEEQFRNQLSFSYGGSFSNSFLNESSWSTSWDTSFNNSWNTSFDFSTSWNTSFNAFTSWNTSWNTSFDTSTSWNTSFDTSFFRDTSAYTSWGPASELSFSFSSWAANYPEFSFSFSSWAPTSFSGSAELYSGLSFTSSGSYSFGSSSSARGIWAPVDNIEGHIVHFYSAFYEQSANWWQNNRNDAIPQINEYWDQRNQRPVYAVVPPSSSSTSTSSSSRTSPPKSHFYSSKSPSTSRHTNNEGL